MDEKEFSDLIKKLYLLNPQLYEKEMEFRQFKELMAFLVQLLGNRRIAIKPVTDDGRRMFDVIWWFIEELKNCGNDPECERKVVEEVKKRIR